MWTAPFWKATGERAAKTFAQAWVAAIVATQVVGVLDLDVTGTLSVAGLATLLSVLTSIGSGAVTGDGPSLTHDEVVAYRPKHAAPDARSAPDEHLG